MGKEGNRDGGWAAGDLWASFLFLYFLKSFFTKIYFWFHNLQFCTPTARLRGGRHPAALLPGGRDLNVNKIYIYSHFGAWGMGR